MPALVSGEGLFVPDLSGSSSYVRTEAISARMSGVADPCPLDSSLRVHAQGGPNRKGFLGNDISMRVGDRMQGLAPAPSLGVSLVHGVIARGRGLLADPSCGRELAAQVRPNVPAVPAG